MALMGMQPEEALNIPSCRPKIIADLLESPTQELHTSVEGEDFDEGEGHVLLHSLSDDGDWVVGAVLGLCADVMCVVSA